MAKAKEDPTEDGETSAEDEALNGLNNPKLDEKTGKPKNRAVSSFKQAHSICKRQYDYAQDNRLKTAATISDKYGGSSPYRQAVLTNAGQGWRSNYSTNPLAAIVDRATPQLKDPIKQADSLTYSSLPATRENAADKTRRFRQRTTRIIRSWPAWDDFVDVIAQDNYLFGNAAPGWIDDDWRPRAFRYDEAFLPEGTGQHASTAQYVMFRQPMNLQDFLRKMEDKEIAEDAGYDWEGCIKAANEAGGLRNSSNRESAFEKVDAIREGGAPDYVYDGEVKIVWMFHLLVREYEGGKVNLWTTSQKGGHAIRFQEGLHDTMEEAVTFFTLQAGNNRFYGSKGAGRMLTNMHIALDRTRNFNNDKNYLAGMPIFQAKGKDATRIEMHVRTPFIIVTGDADLVQEQVAFDMQGAQFMDQQMMQQMEALAGSFIPLEEQDSGTPSTKIADAERVKRQLAVKNGVLGRFFRQFGDLIGAMQRKIYSPDNLKEAQRIWEESQKKEQSGVRIIAAKLFKWIKGILPDLEKQVQPMKESRSADADAVEAIVDLLRDGLTVEDIAELALAPAANSVDEQPEVQDQNVVQLIGAATQNPALSGHFNTSAMAEELAKIQGGPDIAEKFINKQNPDPNDAAANQAQELGEWLVMMNGDPVTAAAFQNHRVRRGVLVTKLKPIMDQMQQAPTPEMLKFCMMAVPHYGQHIQLDKDTPQEDLQKEIQLYQQMEEEIMQAQKVLEDLAKQAQKAGAGADPTALPPNMPNGAQPPANMQQPQVDPTTEAKLQAETARTAADAFMHNQDNQLEHRKLDIKQQELAQKDQHHAQEKALDVAQSAAGMMADARQSGFDAGSTPPPMPPAQGN